MGRRLSILLGFAISIALLCYVLSDVSLSTVLEISGTFNFFLLPPICLIVYVSYETRALRWKYLLGASGPKESLSRYNRSLIIGTLASTVLPLRAGEFVRPWVISRHGKISFAVLFSSVVMERVFDVFGMLFFLGISLRALPEAGSWIVYSANSLVALVAVIAAGALFCIFGERWARWICLRLVTSIFGRKQRARKLVRFGYEIIAGLSSLRSFSGLLIVLGLTLLIWFQYSLTFYLGLVGFGVEANFGVTNLLNGLVALAVAAPSAPGFIGTYQFGVVSALTQFPQYSKDFAVAFSLFFHAIHLCFTLVAGFICLLREKLTFGAMLRKRNEGDEEFRAASVENVFPA